MKRTEKRERKLENALVHQVEDAIRRLERENDPVVQEAEKLVETLRQAETFFEKKGRLDISNSVRAARLSLSAHLTHFGKA